MFGGAICSKMIICGAIFFQNDDLWCDFVPKFTIYVSRNHYKSGGRLALPSVVITAEGKAERPPDL